MKKMILMGLILCAVPTFLFAAEVTFVIDNLKHNDGSIQVGIYDKAESFTKPEEVLKGCASQGKLAGEQARVVCELGPGKYAASLFHDKNNNGKLDKNFIGIPKEGFGFSNNAKGSFGPPKFEDAVFTVEHGDLEMIIQLQY